MSPDSKSRMWTSANAAAEGNPSTGHKHWAERAGHRILLVLGVLSAAGYCGINYLSWRFGFGSPTEQRPIIAVLVLFTLLFAVYLFAIFVARRAIQNRRLLWLIVGSSIAFRILMLFSLPIQEVDIYRYIWDGEVSSQQVSPFRFTPNQVLTANEQPGNDEALNRLIGLRDHNPHVREVLERVHFSELPTIYPPTSQLVFYVAMQTTPEYASVFSRVTIMKAWLIGFDLGVLLLLVGILNLCQKPIGLSVAYGWCPLVLKEIANSGHLDSIAVFLTMLVIYLLVRLLRRTKPVTGALQSAGLPFAIVVVLAAAIAAKLYPVVLAPLVVAVLLRRCGWRLTAIMAAVFLALTFLFLWPILPIHKQTSEPTIAAPIASAASLQTSSDIPLPAPDSFDSPNGQLASVDPSAGVTTFLKSWEMNDFIFMVFIENLKPVSSNPDIWFSIVPDSIRSPVVNGVSRHLSLSVDETPFIITRAITMLASALITLVFAYRFWRDDLTEAKLCQTAFLTIAWFWLLLPTQNPWYWIWALPLLPFVRNRAWFAISGILMIYYLRFWLDYHFQNESVLGSGYQGAAFFDFVITWLEFAPWFLWLAIEGIWKRKHDTATNSV